MIWSFIVAFIILIFSLPGFALDSEFEAGLREFKSGNNVEAQKIYIRLIKKNPTEQIYWFNYGQSLYKSYDFTRAIKVYDRVIGLNGSLKPAAMFYKATSLANIEKAADAKVIAQEILNSEEAPEATKKVAADLVLALDSPNDIHLESAIENYQLDNFSGCLADINQSSLSETPEALQLKGLCYVGLKQTKEAAQEWKSVLRNTQKKELKDSTIALLKEIGEYQKTEPGIGLWASISLSHGIDNNPTQASARSAAVTGINLTPSAVNSALALIGYDFNSRYLEHSFMYMYRLNDFMIDPTIKDESHLFEIDNLLRTNWAEVILSPEYDIDYLGGSPLSQQIGGEATIIINTSAAIRPGLFASHLDQKNLLTGSEYLNGQINTYRGFLEYKVEKNTIVLFYETGTTAIGDLNLAAGILPLANKHTTQGMSATVSLGGSWRFHLRISSTDKIYTNPSAPNGKMRLDRSSNVTAKLRYGITSHWDIFISGANVTNSSTLDDTDIRDKNYSQTSYFLGVTWKH